MQTWLLSVLRPYRRVFVLVDCEACALLDRETLLVA
jgi:hypothetical protein